MKPIKHKKHYDIQASPKVLEKFTWEKLGKFCEADFKKCRDGDFYDVSNIPLSDDNKWVIEKDHVRTLWVEIGETMLVAFCLRDKRCPFYSYYMAEEINPNLAKSLRESKESVGLKTGHYRMRN